MTSFNHKNILTVKELSRKDLETIIHVSKDMEKIVNSRTRTDLLSDKVLGTAFFQASTRTRISFESAMLRLGGGVTGFSDPKMTRAGDFYQESIEDTARMLESYADILVVRHPREFAPRDIANVIDIPVISGGDGYNEHPTQAILDVYSIWKEKGTIDGMKVGLVGDMSIRVMHSLPIALSRFDSEIYLIAPGEMKLAGDWRKEFEEQKVNYHEIDTMEEVIERLDVLYLIPNKLSSFHISRADSKENEEQAPPAFRVDRKLLAMAKESLQILHPLPRKTELPKFVDSTPQAGYFQQAHNGVAVRMSLLALLLGRV